MARYKSEIAATLSNRLEANPTDNQFASLKREFDSLFAPHGEATKNHLHVEQWAISTPVKQMKQVHQEAVIGADHVGNKSGHKTTTSAFDVSAKLPSTPMHLVIKSTVVVSARKSLISSPVSPETLREVSKIETSFIKQSPVVNEVPRMASLHTVKDVPRMPSLDDVMPDDMPDMPSFDLLLGFTQTQHTVTIAQDDGYPNITVVEPVKEVNPYDHPQDIVEDDLSDEEARDHEPLARRMTRISRYNRSPYYKRQVVVDAPLKAIEVKVSERLFSLQGDVG